MMKKRNIFIVLGVLLFLLSCASGPSAPNAPGVSSVSNVPKVPKIPEVSPADPALWPLSRATEPAWLTRHNNILELLSGGKEYDLVLIGDSITHGWENKDAKVASEYYRLKENFSVLNLGFSGDKTNNVLWRLDNGEFPDTLKPLYVAMMIGTNNTGSNFSAESTAASIAKILQKINDKSPTTKIILISILPRAGAGGQGRRDVNDKVNEIIKNYDGFFNCQYFDLGKYFVNDDNSLKKELYNADELHLLSPGYEVWADELLDLLE
jgi:beta-glucosidase